MDLPFNGVGIGGNNKMNKRQSDSFPPSPTNSEMPSCLPCCGGNKDKETSQSDTMKGSRDEIGLTLNDFQRKPNHGGMEERRGNGHDYSPDLARNQTQDNRRHDSENSVTAAIVTTNDGHHDIPPPGYEGHEDQGGHNGSYRPVQMYSTVQSNSSDPATSQQTQVKISNL